MSLTKEEKYALIRALQETEKVGGRKILSLITKFNGLDNLISSSLNQLANVRGIGQDTAKKIFKVTENITSLSSSYFKEIEMLHKISADFVTLADEEYPRQLKNIFTPPLILYYFGEFRKEDENSVAIVGTRKPSVYGRNVAKNISAELTNAGLTIVSGLARGIDSVAHRECLANGGRTIAVIGSGLDVVYPAENKELFARIKENGMIISEYLLGTKPDARNFPRRNRIISGLTLGTVIVETAINGGAMHTAAYALDQGREVFAVPGNINFRNSEGCNALIKRGEAKLIQNAQDILDELPVKLNKALQEKRKPDVQLTMFESKIFDLLGEEPVHIDKIAEKSGLPVADCLVHLLSLEFKGVVRQYPGKLFGRI